MTIRVERGDCLEVIHDLPDNWEQMDSYGSWRDAIAELRKHHLAATGPNSEPAFQKQEDGQENQ